ncbi:MAG: hypothetical protein ABI690_08475 [Chloroflexota bacterium]
MSLRKPVDWVENSPISPSEWLGIATKTTTTNGEFSSFSFIAEIAAAAAA